MGQPLQPRDMYGLFLCAVWIWFLEQPSFSTETTVKANKKAAISLGLACRGTLQFQHNLGEKVAAWPVSMVECHQKECKIRSKGP